MPRSDWPVARSVGNCLDCWWTWRDQPRQTDLSCLRKLADHELGSQWKPVRKQHSSMVSDSTSALLWILSVIDCGLYCVRQTTPPFPSCLWCFILATERWREYYFSVSKLLSCFVKYFMSNMFVYNIKLFNILIPVLRKVGASVASSL